MQTDIAPADTATVDSQPRGLVSVPFLLLRVSTAGGAFATGFIQTLVFARVLTPDRFSLFILVGAVGYSLWLCDLGLAKILFVQLRAAHLAGEVALVTALKATLVSRGWATDDISAKAYWNRGRANAGHGEPELKAT